jgi:MFS family permease
VPVAGLAIAVVAVTTLAVDPAGVSLAGVSAILFVAGAGVGPMYPVTTVVIQNVVPPHHTGTATGTLNFFRQLGGAIIVAAFGAIVLGALDGAGDAAALETLAGINRAGADFATTFRWVFIVAAAFLGLACLAMMAVEERPLRGRGERQ